MPMSARSVPLSLVTDNSSAFKSGRFKGFIDGLEDIRHVRTRRHARIPTVS